jgi:hypothetical protein
MDIEKLKKVNQLATTLRAQGLAVGRDDAVQLAGKLNLGIEDNDLSDIMNVRGDARMVTVQQHAYMEEENMRRHEKKSELDEEKIMKILQSFADEVSKEVNMLNEKVQKQERAMNDLLQVLKQMDSSKQDFSAPVAMVQPRQETIQMKEEPKKTSPRSGGFNSSDVAIDKFFYYGNK